MDGGAFGIKIESRLENRFHKMPASMAALYVLNMQGNGL
jgi:hypothetical protein